MATYKVIQDIEAEDKFVGPLTLKQFIFAAITVVSCYISFLFITKHVWFLALPLLPVIITGGFLAFPWGRDQPTETWLLAKIRFFFKPRLRIWDQDGVEELVTVTAPKKVEEVLTNNLSQTEVKSRLRALADTIDSRGWAVKNVNVNMFADPSYGTAVTGSSDRLVTASALPQVVTAVDVRADDDILDAQNNPVAQKLDQMISQATQEHHKEMIDNMQAVRDRQAAKVTDQPAQSQQNLWFMDQPDSTQPLPAGYTTFSTQTVSNSSDLPQGVGQSGPLSAEEKALLDKLHKEQGQEVTAAYGHMRVVQPLSARKKQPTRAKSKIAPPNRDKSTSDKVPDPAILELASNNDRNVASLAREANKKRGKEPPANEVVISLR